MSNLGNTRLNERGATPFLLAALTADAPLMKLLVSLGADPNLTNAEDEHAADGGRRPRHASPGEDAGTEAEVLEAVQVALDLGDDVNAVDKNGETAMHGAAYKNLPKVVQFLVARGARIDVWNRPNKYGLDAARHCRRVSVRQLQALAGDRGRHPPGDDRGRRHAARRHRREDAADLLNRRIGNRRPATGNRQPATGARVSGRAGLDSLGVGQAP